MRLTRSFHGSNGRTSCEMRDVRDISERASDQGEEYIVKITKD
jgi:hypothetical protein